MWYIGVQRVVDLCCFDWMVVGCVVVEFFDDLVQGYIEGCFEQFVMFDIVGNLDWDCVFGFFDVQFCVFWFVMC